jgi:hypothetical protein
MSSLPPPPANLHGRKLPLYSLRRRQAALVRLAWANPATHLPFRRDARYRFDAPDASFGVVYAALDLETAFVETIVRDRPGSPTGPAIMLDYAELADRRVVVLDTHAADRPLRLVKLYEDGLATIGTDNRISTADDYAATRPWAKALYDHPETPDGLIYLSRYLGNRRSVVLFERCRPQVALGSIKPLLRHPQLAMLLDRYRIGLLPVPSTPAA